MCRDVLASRNETSSVECSQLGAYPDLENDVQSTAALYIMYYKYVEKVPALFLPMFCGAWSDRLGRKPPIFLSCIGVVVPVIFYMISGKVMDTWSLFVCLVFVGTAIGSIVGKSALINAAIHRSRLTVAVVSYDEVYSPQRQYKQWR